jgi:starch synthase (maltosyl-transferring)
LRIAEPEAHLERCLALGFEGFICRSAAYVPPAEWAKLIAAGRRVNAASCFVADTLGAGPGGAVALQGVGFDYVFNSVGWWDFRSDWLLEEQRQLSLVAPTLSFAESRETDRLAAHESELPGALEAWIKFRLLFAAVFSGGWLMPAGCEYGFRRRMDPLRTTPADWEAPRLDLTGYVTMLNGLRSRFPALDVKTPIRRLSAPGSRGVALLRLAAGHPLAAESGLVLLLNPDPQQPVSLAGERLMSETGGLFGQFTDVTPDRAPRRWRRDSPSSSNRWSFASSKPGARHRHAARRNPAACRRSRATASSSKTLRRRSMAGAIPARESSAICSPSRRISSWTAMVMSRPAPDTGKKARRTGWKRPWS